MAFSPEELTARTSRISVNRFCLRYHVDYLQWEMNIYFSYLFYLLIYNVYFHSVDAEKNNASDLLLCIREADIV